MKLAVELLAVRRLLSGKSDSCFLRMPMMVDEEKRFCMQILPLIYHNSAFCRTDLVPFIILQMMKITIKYGMSEYASLAFANYGMLCVHMFGDVNTG